MGKHFTIPTTQGSLKAYEAKPAGSCRGGIIVIHEVWGIAGHIKEVADRLASEGFLAFAPDFLSDYVDIGKTAGLQEDLFNPEKRNEAQPKLRKLMTPMFNPEFGEATTSKLLDCFSYVHELQDVGQKVAVIGFCFGGTYSFTLAVNEPRLKLALPFYGHSDQTVDELKNIACPVRAFYGEKDENLMAGLPDLKDRMEQAGVDFEAKVYPNCGHAFFNETNRFAYNKAAAADAWQQILKYLKEYVG